MKLKMYESNLIFTIGESDFISTIEDGGLLTYGRQKINDASKIMYNVPYTTQLYCLKSVGQTNVL